MPSLVDVTLNSALVDTPKLLTRAFEKCGIWLSLVVVEKETIAATCVGNESMKIHRIRGGEDPQDLGIYETVVLE